MDILRIRFDVPEPFLEIDTFMASAEAAQRAVNAINLEFFDGALEVVVVVMPPEQGSLRQVLGVIVKRMALGVYSVGALASFAFLVADSKTVNDVMVAFTGKPVSGHVIEFLRERKRAADAAKGMGEKEAILSEIDGAARRELERIISDAAGGSLVTSRSVIERLPISDRGRYEIGIAQSQLFEACQENVRVVALEIEDTGIPPIPRNDFPDKARRPKPLNNSEDDPQWHVIKETITVTSPNFDPEDQLYRKWKGYDSDRREKLFTIVDAKFWLAFHRKEVVFREETKITVQIAARIEKNRYREFKVIGVLEVDEVKLSQPLTDEALSAILGSFTRRSEPEQPNLFD